MQGVGDSRARGIKRLEAGVVFPGCADSGVQGVQASRGGGRVSRVGGFGGMRVRNEGGRREGGREGGGGREGASKKQNLHQGVRKKRKKIRGQGTLEGKELVSRCRSGGGRRTGEPRAQENTRKWKNNQGRMFFVF